MAQPRTVAVNKPLQAKSMCVYLIYHEIHACMAEQVAELSGRVAALQMSLQLSAMREFELLGTGEDKPNPLLLERLRACCLVIDVLGFKVRVHAGQHSHGPTMHDIHRLLEASPLPHSSPTNCCNTGQAAPVVIS